MSENIPNNPFAGLFSSTIDQSVINTDKSDASSLSFQVASKENIQINDTVEKIFHITLNNNTNISKKQLIYLEDLAESVSPQNWIDLELLEQALFERILLPDPFLLLRPKNIEHPNTDVCEKNVIIYLYKSYQNVKSITLNDASIIEKIIELIMRNAVTAFRQPELFEDQNLSEQLLTLFTNVEFQCASFIWDFVKKFNDDKDDAVSINDIFIPILQNVHKEIATFRLLSVNIYVYDLLYIFSNNEDLASVLLDYCTPLNYEVGINYANSLLGSLLCVSILPKTNNGRYEYFDSPLDQANTVLEGNLWMAVNTLTENLHTTFLNLLKCSPKIKHQTLSWISNCLKYNSSRGKLWNTHAPPELNPVYMTTVSDGFMLNLASVILRLCTPFCSKSNRMKILKVDPTYCAVQAEEADCKGVHLFQMSEETCLVPFTAENENIKRPTAVTYNFVTECFFLAHRTLDLGFRVSIDRLIHLNQEMSQIQRAYTDALNQGGGRSDVLESMKIRMEVDMQRYCSLKSALMEPNLLSHLMDLHSATSLWLTQVSFHLTQPESEENKSFAPLTHITVEFPLSLEVPSSLQCIPEFVVENIVGYLSFLRRFSPRTLEEHGYDSLAPILTMVLTYMGAAHRMRNPHLRARLAECLEAMLPRHKDEPENLNPLGGFQRERLFIEHPHKDQIVKNLLDVFVGIEMTGQSVQFEQKFNYRRPMYIIMDYLWEIEEHRNCFKLLAEETEANMEAVSPPIYLRFINLLMNDAVFLLDEALSNMAQLRSMQTARENGEWNQLSSSEREQNLAHMQHTGMLARFDNILGKETTHMLKLLTAGTSSIFIHSTMVDRVAAMLNYFLLHLVGPKKKNFKVKDQKEFEFDPANTVLDICHIYVALGSSDSFCLAVSQDGRSYSPQLFSLAEDVLARIGGGSLISELQCVANRVAELSSQKQAEDEALSDVPDEFLDPIMSTIMLDPVILPSSKQTVDRTTIARHILSDQTDPFNRSPLTMDQVFPNKELALRIKEWIFQKKIKKTNNT